MIRFLDGPAAGKGLLVKRAPLLLRVVRDREAGTFDALDQLADTPRPSEEIFVYLLSGKAGSVHIDSRDKQGRRHGENYATGDYYVLLDQPADADVRTNDAWRTWANQYAAAREVS